jgi:hypothetical protein
VYPRGLAERCRAAGREVLASGMPKMLDELYAGEDGRAWVETFRSPVRDEMGAAPGNSVG